MGLISRVKTWVANETLTASDLNAEFDNIVDNYPGIETIWVPASAMIPTITNGAAAGVKEFASNDIMKEYLAFDPSTEEYACFDLVMSESWNLGTVKAKFYWIPVSTATAAEIVIWGIQGLAISDDAAVDATMGTAVTVTDAVTAGKEGDIHISSATASITIGGTPALGDLVQFKVYRDADAGGDTMDGEDAWLIGALIQFTQSETPAAW